MTPEEKVIWLRLHHDHHVKQLEKEFKQVWGSPRNLDHKADRLLDIFERLTALISPVSACKKGCSHCCYQAVTIFDWEADRIAKFSKRKRTEFAGLRDKSVLGARDKSIELYTGKVCLFLADGRCSIYEVRPIACRLHLNLGDDPAVCDIITDPEGDVPYFNFQEWVKFTTIMFIEMGATIGDIREFFSLDAKI